MSDHLFGPLWLPMAAFEILAGVYLLIKGPHLHSIGEHPSRCLHTSFC